ncbi:IS66 family transposase [Mesorhizobium sp.]|uniref:IS66 family transposase n=1 Tax=Mesorhizobium sp. TaxID=1871066 RepID=UPI000FE6453A|nr:IS66 family transposase [Mesorhizobium sp.]RWL06429.1 MAG: IS66 family transposase [Mesorhizobium sp.]
MVATAQDAVPDDIGALRAALTAALARAEDEAARAALVEAELAVATAKASDDAALIAHQHLTIRKLQRALHGQSSERSARLHDQMELTFEELESTATEDEIAAEQAAARTTEVAPFVRKRPVRQPFPEHLPRERMVEPAPAACHCCGGHRLRKLGEDITETLEVVPRQWKVIQHVREKFTCRDCETISQAPAPFHATPRGWAGPGLLAMILFEKFGQHQPLNRQAERYAREGVPLSLSTLADQVGAGAAALMPLFKRLEAHVLAASRLHGDDTTVPVLAKGKTDTGRLWTYVRDDRPFGGADPPAAVFYYSRDRRGEHPAAHLAGWSGILQADAFGGYGELYATGRQPTPVLEASCWAHSRRKVFDLADIEAAARKKARGEKPNLVYPLAVEAVKRIDALFDIERAINGLSPAQRHAVRQERSAPLVTELERWMIETRDKLSRGHDLTKAFNYMLRRWSSFTRFLDDGRICLSNNAAERALRGIALGRKSWLFCGSDRGGQRAAVLYSLIVSAKMNDIDPQVWLADVLARLPAYPAHRIDDLLPWNWSSAKLRPQPAAA